MPRAAVAAATRVFVAAVVVVLALCAIPRAARAHCDGCDGVGRVAVRIRGGPSLFPPDRADAAEGSGRVSPAPPPAGGAAWCRPVVIVQCHHELPGAAALGLAAQLANASTGAAMNSSSLAAAFGGLSYAEKTFLVNSAYAAAHDLGYAFFAAGANSSRHPAWLKLRAAQHVLRGCPGAGALYLDNDAYVRALADPVRLDEVAASAHGAVLAVALDCAWFAHAAAAECTGMARHQARFEAGDWDRGGGSTVNTGVAVFMPGQGTVEFIDHWWNVTFEGVEALRGCRGCGRDGGRWPWEQTVLSRMLSAMEPADRARVRLLDPSAYNGPRGNFVRHLYGTWRVAPLAGDDLQAAFLEAARRLEHAPRGASPAAPQLIPDFVY